MKILEIVLFYANDTIFAYFAYEYRNNAYLIKDALANIKSAYLP